MWIKLAQLNERPRVPGDLVQQAPGPARGLQPRTLVPFNRQPDVLLIHFCQVAVATSPSWNHPFSRVGTAPAWVNQTEDP